jgi:glutaminase
MYVDLTEGKHYQNEQRPTGSFSTPLKRITLIRSMAIVISLIFALQVLDCDIALDRISTHPTGNFFGLLRKLLYDRNKLSELVHAGARNVIVTAIVDELRHPRDICGRENLGRVVSQTEGRTFEDA